MLTSHKSCLPSTKMSKNLPRVSSPFLLREATFSGAVRVQKKHTRSLKGGLPWKNIAENEQVSSPRKPRGTVSNRNTYWIKNMSLTIPNLVPQRPFCYLSFISVAKKKRYVNEIIRFISFNVICTFFSSPVRSTRRAIVVTPVVHVCVCVCVPVPVTLR